MTGADRKPRGDWLNRRTVGHPDLSFLHSAGRAVRILTQPARRHCSQHVTKANRAKSLQELRDAMSCKTHNYCCWEPLMITTFFFLLLCFISTQQLQCFGMIFTSAVFALRNITAVFLTRISVWSVNTKCY